MANSGRFAVVGEAVPQIDGVDKISGKAIFTADIQLPGILWCKILRSPYPHARILRVDTSRARAVPGVHAVVSGQELPDVLFGRRMWDMPVLARDRVRFIGERVAGVAAETAATAEEALNLIEVDYEELPAVFDPLEAMRPGAPEIHPSVAGYHNHLEPVPDTPNTYSAMLKTSGDVEEGFAQADRVFEHVFTTHSHHQGYLEPHAAVVHITDDGRVQLWESNKQPLAGRNQLSSLTGVPKEQIVAHAVHMGADFGGKGSLMDTAVAYWLAKASGRPVKTVMTYTEELTAANPRNPVVITMRTGVRADGTFTAHHVRCVWNTGAYQAFLAAGAVGGGLWAAGLYRVPNVRLENIGVYTNCTPRGHVRAPGAPQVAFALESHVDMMAHALGIDPVEFRMRNLIESGETSATGEEMIDIHAKKTLEASSRAADWGSPRRAPYVGRGIAVYDRHTGSGKVSVVLGVDREGTVTLHTTAPDTGTGNHTILQQIIAEELKVPLPQVRIHMTDSDLIPEDAGVGGSRVTHVYGRAALASAQEVRAKLIAVAAEMLGAEPAQIVLGAGRFSADSRALPFAQVAQRAAPAEGGELRVSYTYDGGRPEGIASFSAQIAEVEVDPETGQVRVRRFVSAHDVGTIINPMYHQGQIDGGVIYGLGFALTEELLIEEGRVLNPNLGEYKLPNVQDIPELVTVLVPGATGPTPYSGKAIGEMGNVPVAGAIANAVYDAVGVRITDLPITAEKVYRQMQAQAAR